MSDVIQRQKIANLQARFRWLKIVCVLLGLATSPRSGLSQAPDDASPSVLSESAAAAQIDFFEQHVAPIFRQRCLECHAGADPDGGLSLTTREQLLLGGDSGPAIDLPAAAKSVLWQRVTAGEMPPDSALPAEETALLQQWLIEGAAWGPEPLERNAQTTASRAGVDWWSLQPLQVVTPPQANQSGWVRNAVDPFILDQLLVRELAPAPEASPRELLRRLFIDLIGLPPDPEQVARYEADPSEAAYVKWVEQLLASPEYGKRWGRHWLDVVRFGESDGFERNFPRENAWYYRDWVIAALNAGMPYDQFVRQQLVGDLELDGLQGAAATGFWTAGVHNTVVGGSRRMRELARQDEIEDVLGTVGQTFLGLTLNCARCHDHKFDPISLEEYYRLASTISGLGFGDRTVQSTADVDRLAALDEELSHIRDALRNIERSAREELKQHPIATLPSGARQTGEPTAALLPTPFALWEFDVDLEESLSGLHGLAHGSATVRDGALRLDGRSYVSTPPLPVDMIAKTMEVWVQLDDLEQAGGAALSLQTADGNIFDAIVFGEQQPRRWMAGSDSFARTAPFGSQTEGWLDEAEAVERPVHIVLVYHADGSIDAYRNGERYGNTIHKSPAHRFAKGENKLLFGLRHEPGMENRFLRGAIHRGAIYDRALTKAEVAATFAAAPSGFSVAQLQAVMAESTREQWNVLRSRVGHLQSQRATLAQQATRQVYTLVPGNGEETRLLRRGDPEFAGETLAPGALAAVAASHSDFELPSNAPEANRRSKLADWITADDNPLFARVIANRLWHYHFGVGLVDTPNDFGFNGGRPSHPQLLDYLATQLRDQAYDLKKLHRLLVTSSTYRQTAISLPVEQIQKGASIDATNRWLWRGPVRRLEAEVLRDAMLVVAGELNGIDGGPSFRDVSVTENSGTTYYEPLDVEGGEYWRRTVYRFNPRGGRSALLDTFDCPDPAAAAPRRAVTTTPLQALSLLNNGFVLRMSQRLAQRVARESGGELPDQVRHAWRLAMARDPSDAEYARSLELASHHGLEALCRGLFNLNEFVSY